jgi:hypothetical protein
MEWLGHDVRMGAVRTVKKLLESKPGGGGKSKTYMTVDGWCRTELEEYPKWYLS